MFNVEIDGFGGTAIDFNRDYLECWIESNLPLVGIVESILYFPEGKLHLSGFVESCQLDGVGYNLVIAYLDLLDIDKEVIENNVMEESWNM